MISPAGCLTNYGETRDSAIAANIDTVGELRLIRIGGEVVGVAELVDRESEARS